MIRAMTKLTPNSAAERCGKSRATILRAVAAKDLPAEKIGAQWAIDAADLDLWAAQRPQRARRRPAEGQSRGNVGDEVPEAHSGPVSAPEGAGEAKALTARLDALEALCNALRAEMEELRAQVSRPSPATPPQAPKDASQGATPTKWRLWPF